MTMTAKQPTLEQFKAWAKAHKPLALAVLQAQAYAEVRREQVDAYIKPIFDTYRFYVSKEFRDTAKDERITTPNDLYLTDLDDPLVKAYYEDCDKAHHEHGFTGPKGHCPALEAEHLLMEAQNHLLDCGAELTGISASDLYGDNRAKMLELLLGACMSKR